MTQDAQDAAVNRKKNSSPAARPASGTGQAFQHYQAALQLLQQGRYDKALAAFEKLLSSAPAEIAERCHMYMSTCQRQLDDRKLNFQTPEERYDYAVSQLNGGYYEEAREQFESILADFPAADYAFYGLAIIESITGHAQECLNNLSQAIHLNPGNRIQARADNDFQNMADDPRFTELLYPEVP